MALESSGIFGRRYRLLNHLGSGGMGSVYRAFDLLTGRVIVLKRVLTPTDHLDFGAQTVPHDHTEDMRWALAQEYELLSSLRHPHIISVVSYGFDEEGLSYYTMNLEEGARDLITAGIEQPLLVQIELLVQLLLALDYLHWRGIIHRDLKPGNVLVVDGRVKVVDFGLSVDQELLEYEMPAAGGTLAYVAPEVLRGEGVSAASDLFAVGVMAYELFAGRHPFNTGMSSVLIQEIMGKEADVADLEVSRALSEIIKKLLDKEPAARYQDARSVISDLGLAVGRELAPETIRTRESFLQSADLIGRGAEISQLSSVLSEAQSGQGSLWLIAGESGVGKSRLVRELRTMAQVRGALVVGGQGVQVGGGPYRLWREVARWLCLLTELSDLEAGVLRALVPDVESLIGRSVPDIPACDAQGAHNRMVATFREALRRLDTPVVLLLEDIHWAGSESVEVLAALASVCAEGRLLAVATYRDDERPELAAAIAGARVIKLGRFAPEQIEEFVSRIVGAQRGAGGGLSRELVTLLRRETEGNPLFLVEVLRALAEEAGRLDRIPEMTLPERVAVGGVQKLIQRRLKSVPADARPLLELAAIVGRFPELSLLEALSGGADLEPWINTVISAAVLEVDDNRLRFAHDQLREALLSAMSAEKRQELHHMVAEAIEEAGRDGRERALAHHWAAAGDLDRAFYYHVLAGEQALRSGASREAVIWIERGLDLIPAPGRPRWTPQAIEPIPLWTASELSLEQGRLEALLAEANFRLGQLGEVRIHGERALASLGAPLPSSTLGFAIGTVMQVAARVVQSIRRKRAPVAESERLRHLVAARVQQRLTEVYIFSEKVLEVLWSGLRTLNLGEPAGDSPELARGYALMAVVAGSVPLHKVAQAWSDRALTMVESAKAPSSLVYVAVRRGVYGIGTAQWAVVEADLSRALDVAEGLGDKRLWDEVQIILSKACHYQGRLKEGAEVGRMLHASAVERGDDQCRGWGLIAMNENLVRQGRVTEAQAYFKALMDWLPSAASTERLCPVGMMALGHLRLGEVQAAAALADQALELAKTTNTLVYWTLSGMTGALETHLELMEKGAGPGAGHWEAGAQALLGVLKAFARVFPFGRPAVHLWRGVLLGAQGDPLKATASLKLAVEKARALGMRWDEGRALLELGRQAGSADEACRYLEEAEGVLKGISAKYDLVRAKSYLSERRGGV